MTFRSGGRQKKLRMIIIILPSRREGWQDGTESRKVFLVAPISLIILFLRGISRFHLFISIRSVAVVAILFFPLSIRCFPPFVFIRILINPFIRFIRDAAAAILPENIVERLSKRSIVAFPFRFLFFSVPLRPIHRCYDHPFLIGHSIPKAIVQRNRQKCSFILVFRLLSDFGII